jgi:hypothetical protein
VTSSFFVWPFAVTLYLAVLASRVSPFLQDLLNDGEIQVSKSDLLNGRLGNGYGIFTRWKGVKKSNTFYLCFVLKC